MIEVLNQLTSKIRDTTEKEKNASKLLLGDLSWGYGYMDQNHLDFKSNLQI